MYSQAGSISLTHLKHTSLIGALMWLPADWDVFTHYLQMMIGWTDLRLSLKGQI